MRYFSACNFAPGPSGYGLAALDDVGRVVWSAAVPARGHTVEVSPEGSMLALIDRKPGAAITLYADGTVLQRIAAPESWHFGGHAVFSSDCTRLYATESRDSDQAGRIAVIDLHAGKRIAAFSSGGIEPHELIWAEPDRTLAIGNGGLVDRLATEGEADSNFTLVDARSGALQSELRLDEDLISLSIRHLVRTRDGEIVFAMQDQDPATDWRPSVGVVREGTVEFLDMPRAELTKLRGYCGSVAIDRSGTIAAATSPHGGYAALWNVPERRYLGGVELRDGCGIAAAEMPGAFVFTAGSGARLMVTASSTGVTSRGLERPVNGLPQWDNHLTPARD